MASMSSMAGKLPDADDVLGMVGLQRTAAGASLIAALAPFVAGLAIGALLGVLFAPRRGRDLRDELRTRARSMSDDLRGHASDMMSEGSSRPDGEQA